MRKTIMKNAVNEDIYYVTQKDFTRSIFKIRMCGITYPDKTYEVMRPKDNNCAGIEYIEKGEGTVHLGDKTFYPQAGDTYFLHPKNFQHYYSDSENPWKKCFVCLSGSLFDNLVEGYQLNNLCHFKGLDIKKEIYDIIELTKNKISDNTDEIICIVNKILYKMRMHAYMEKNTPDLAEKMKDYLNSHVTDKFKIEELCNYISKSKSHTIRIFKDAYGITPYAYVLNKKIGIAKDLLLNTNLSIKQISSNLSFTDEYYFSNIFKNKTGVSPFNYRKNKKMLNMEKL